MLFETLNPDSVTVSECVGVISDHVIMTALA